MAHPLRTPGPDWFDTCVMQPFRSEMTSSSSRHFWAIFHTNSTASGACQADDPELFADFDSTTDTGVPFNQQMVDTANLLATAGPRAPNDTKSTDNSVGQTASDNLIGQTAVVYTMVHTASKPVVMQGLGLEVTTPTAQPGFALSTTANIWLCMMLLMTYYFI